MAWKMINARAETVAKMPAFKNAFEKRRCLLPRRWLLRVEESRQREAALYDRHG
jgi:putative SOS response-associated peptidase YedK